MDLILFFFEYSSNFTLFRNLKKMKTSKILTTSILIAASAALANAAEENTVLWSAKNINLGTEENKTFTDVTIPSDGITLKLDVSNWTAQNSAFCWFTTTSGNNYQNSAAIIGWGKPSEKGGSFLYNLSGGSGNTTVSGEGFDRENATSYTGTGSATQNVSTVLFITVQNSTATLYEKNKAGNEVVKVASISNMNGTSTINGLHIGSWGTAHSGTMDAALYSGVLSTDTMNSILNVPEPSMFGVFAGLGALALVGSRRRRK